MECTLLTSKGEKKTVLKTVVPVRIDDRSYLLESILDISERKRAEEALRESEERYRSLAETAQDFIYIIDKNDNVVYVNNYCQQMLKKTRDDIIGKPRKALFPEPVSTKQYQDLQQVIATGIPLQEVSHLPISGQEIWYDTRLVPLRSAEGTISAVLGISRDITQLKHTEEALRESEGKLNAMLQSIPDHMSMMDKDLNIIWANDTAKQYFGNDLVGRKCYEVYHERQNPCDPYPCITLKAFQDGEIHRHETSLIDIHGQTHFFECSANVTLSDTCGKPVVVLEISRDITGRKQAEDALRASAERYRSLAETAQDFIYIIDSNDTVV
ncbi:MAG: PAS domain-containing protein, partial [Methanoregula sp.]|nr:PAS domain-containing protein [Methanoregula sp.]